MPTTAEEYMKRRAFAMSALVLPIIFADAADANPSSQQPGPIVSCAWLESHTTAKNLVILDIRPAAEYEAGHIRNSISAPFEVPFSAWITMREDLLLELPDTADLFAVLSSLGITRNSRVVVVTSFAQPPYPLAGATRVADTLRYVGVQHVSILDGGYPAWVAQGRATTTNTPTLTPSTYAGTVNADMFVDSPDTSQLPYRCRPR
jgi:thiosulfate/3-mercaptopyruvate sulfurtransferase